eukprot:CAMPEP_0202691748 /NCGR_PEP_ID=MMETSP1385-20130828/6381_1 /ASSEMBLY_ACC=CAM_ASM_000861 /TAXON_ID=933848 /ORGANISM="Elphidium margaritaceum" /LENGTH=56 /DNA_ID=CAMNT_0049347195 /DNA_START=32 /DNA_END=202 /DNA_ORIENTATION=-
MTCDACLSLTDTILSFLFSFEFAAGQRSTVAQSYVRDDFADALECFGEGKDTNAGM